MASSSLSSNNNNLQYHAIIFAHGLQYPNKFFIVPEGYEIVFLQKGGQDTSNSVLTDTLINDNSSIKKANTRTKMLAAETDYYHVYKAGDLVNQHHVNFSDNGETSKLLTGIIHETPITKFEFAENENSFIFDKSVFKIGASTIQKNAKIDLSKLLLRLKR